ncbi:MAG: 7-carboxy-7-deazaguanine synthase QueE [Euryarchaeota archaeon]|nr:7-carboxy-7-deazaguanine synthase QueE [Euryarchaeota archaeon]MBU4491761.1 7-carboxy-7-deazaguanine synthase QueE [Euryarchaeota archaeon]MCG2727572.1 7-carboxy-7-deazaguanine synthase QueE [Candidatus Methanoperedenaceae archaeon]
MGFNPAYISEIFNSIQGEGLYVGTRQVFVRFEQCQLHCAYCDTPQARNVSESCRVEKTPGKGDFYNIKNPLDKEDVKELIRKLWSPSTRHVSLTGGEPLIHADFIKTLNLQYPLYLETNAGFPKKAKELKDIVAIASCDIKLPEHGSTDHYAELLRNELKTISIFNETSKTFVKIIVLPETTIQSISHAVDGVESIDPGIPFILQPVTDVKQQVSSRLLLELMDFAGKKLKDVRAIPQTHKIIGLL